MMILISLSNKPLPSHCIHFFALFQTTVEAVEIDQEMVAVAKQWFGFQASPRLKVTVSDGLDYCKKQANSGEYFSCCSI